MKKINWTEVKADVELYIMEDGFKLCATLILLLMAFAIITDAGEVEDGMARLVGIGVSVPFFVGFVIMIYMPGRYEFAKLHRAIERLEKKGGT